MFGGDTSALVDAERGLTPWRRRRQPGPLAASACPVPERFPPTPTPRPPRIRLKLPLFERALELYLGHWATPVGEAEALFWVGCVHQSSSDGTTTPDYVPYLQRSAELAGLEDRRQAFDPGPRSLRHLGIAAHATGRLDEARERLEESSRLRRDVGALSGVASNMVGLAYIAAAQDRRADALATLDEAYAIASAHGAHAIVRHIEEARTRV